MKFSEFYNDAQRELTSTFISMFAKGKPEYANHLRWLFENNEKEKLVQEPVFQTVFPWETVTQTMGELTDLLGQDFIDALDGAKFKEPLDNETERNPEDMSFKKNIKPYVHQVESWTETLSRNKSILVTTGTGSGKTECFMVPVLKDLYDERKRLGQVNPGVQAIFLYPLNALIASQRKRIHAWCDALSPKITYGIYTGDTPQNVNQDKRNKSFPQIIDRDTLRDNPPQILFTNPTMLEYMMVRGEDQSLIDKSRNLKWIILDEAHTYNGSSATELAMLIKRVLKLFGKEPSQVKFAITSATIGEGHETEMKKFISKLTGKDADAEFHFVSGKRVVPKLDSECHLAEINRKFGLNITYGDILSLRERLNEAPALSLREICNFLGFHGSTSYCLELIDALSDEGTATIGGTPSALLPVRAHFFGRSVNGLYACTNHECDRYRQNHVGIGALTSIASQTCPVCKGKMLEVVRCNSCGEFLLQGERITDLSLDADPTVSHYAMKDNTVRFGHLLDDEDEPDENEGDGSAVLNANSQLLLGSAKDDAPFNDALIISHSLDPINGIISLGDDFTSCSAPSKDANELLCPECGESGTDCRKISFSSAFESRLLAHIFLKQSPPRQKPENPNELIYDGRKYITFTDNRQRTANITQGANVSVEREWMRSMILYELLDRRKSVDVDEVRRKILKLESMIQRDPSYESILRPFINDEKKKLIAKPISSWEDFKSHNLEKPDLKRLYKQLGSKENRIDLYLKALFIDQMGSKPLRSNSLETLGLVHLDYPAINELSENDVPGCFVDFYGYSKDEISVALKDWKDFLRICIDYEIRRNSHLEIPDESILRKLVTQHYYSDPIFSNFIGKKVKRENGRPCKRWPMLESISNPKVSRLPLILLLGKGFSSPAELDDNIKDDVNSILGNAWSFLTKNILKNIGENVSEGSDGPVFPGYKLDIFDSERVKLSLIESATVCPRTSQILDCAFRGISPMAKGRLDSKTLEKYSIVQRFVSVPQMAIKESDFVNEDGSMNINSWREAVAAWFDNDFAPVMQPIGGDLSAQRDLFLKRPIFITKEHSAQIESEKLRESERLFEKGQVNVLSCSTTMEMGVDIGGISAVVMNNVPPKPANYLQRTGRAGRRSETQALALTLCNDDPIGRQVLETPKWAMDHEIESPFISFSSVTIMQRQVNSLFLGEYIRKQKGGDVNDQIGAFIFGKNDDGSKTINYTFDGFMHDLDTVKSNSDVVRKVKDVVKGTAYESETIDHMVSQCRMMIKSICSDVQGAIEFMQGEMSSTTNGKNKKRLEYRIKSLWGQNLYSYLSGHNFLPSNSIPTNVVSLAIDRSSVNKKEADMTEIQRPLAMAIQEYAPGREVVVNNLVYPVLGIDPRGGVTGEYAKEKYVSKCPSCGFVSLSFLDMRHCPECGSKFRPIFAGQVKTSTLSVEPTGFVAGDYRRTKKPKLSSEFVVPELLGMKPWNGEDDDALYRIRTSMHADAQILYVNKGDGYGFAYCEYCGKMEPEHGLEETSAPLPKAMKNHKSIVKGTRCYGNNVAANIKRNVMLSACYHTDIAELDVRSEYNPHSVEHKKLLYTLGTIISNVFTQRLGVNEDEVWFGITPINTIFFYDTTPGGAGYSSQLPVYIETVLDNCLRRLQSCECEIACTNCLIDHRSQWFVEPLDKHLAIKWLQNEHENRQIIPDDLKEKLGTNTIRKITHDISSEILGRLRKQEYNSVEYFLKDGLLDDDVLENLEQELLYTNLMRTPVTMVVSYNDAIKPYLSMGLRISLNSFKERFSSLKAVGTQPDGVIPIATFNVNEDKCVYVKYESGIYLAQNPTKISLRDYEVNLIAEPDDVCFVKPIRDEKVWSDSLLATIMGDKQDRLKAFLSDKDKQVHVVYTDIYINNPLSCLILAQVLRTMKDDFGINITDIRVETGLQFDICDDPRKLRYLDCSFNDSSEREQYLTDTLNANIGAVPVSIVTDKKLPHYRMLSLYNGDFEITINPDGGFGQGWRTYRIYRDMVQNDRTMSLELTNKLFSDNLPVRFTMGWRQKKSGEQ